MIKLTSNLITVRYQFRDPQLGVSSVGGFNWNLIFTWHRLPLAQRPADPTEPVPSPTMAGGLFAINKENFQRLGSYDPGFDIWGGEESSQIILIFKFLFPFLN